MRTFFVAGNWKMHKNLAEAKELVEGIKSGLAGDKVDVAVCPPFTALTTVAELVKGSSIKLGAQNCYFETQGAFTGEVSPVMLKDAGCTHVIIGHSERRAIFGESGEMLNKKVRAAFEHGLDVIFCIGETLEQREAGQTESVVERQLDDVLGTDLPTDRLTLAYEPVWAIGTGVTASPEQAQEVHAFIRPKLAGIFGQQVADTIRIQYGGSVKPGNAKELMSCPDVDGALVGGACLKPEDFCAIIKAASEV